MAKRKKKSQRKPTARRRGDRRRRWVTTLASEVPPGPQGQPAHHIGDEVALVQEAEVPGLGKLGFAVPRPSALLLEAGRAHLRRAAQIRKGLRKITTDRGFIRPHFDRVVTDESVLFDYFQEAMAGIIMSHAALDCYASESIPQDFTFIDGAEPLNREALERRGIELRLSRVLSQALHRPNLRTDQPPLWDRALHLKSLRDDVAHMTAPGAYSFEQPQQTIFARLLLEEDLEGLAQTVDQVIGHYGLMR